MVRTEPSLRATLLERAAGLLETAGALRLDADAEALDAQGPRHRLYMVNDQLDYIREL